MQTGDLRLIETDRFPFEFLSQIGERESWRKELHRPIYHIHKWWAQRLGSIFRGILLGAARAGSFDLAQEFYSKHHMADISVLDPFMGSGTTLGEAHKLGMVALGRDINPVAVQAVSVALGHLDFESIRQAYGQVKNEVREKILSLYESTDSKGAISDVLYYFWVMQANCPECQRQVDLFPSRVVAYNANPKRSQEIKVVCPLCAFIFGALLGDVPVDCPACGNSFLPRSGNVSGAKATCEGCRHCFVVLKALGGKRPCFRLFGKLVLTKDGTKEYLAATNADQAAYTQCSGLLCQEVNEGKITLPCLHLEKGNNTRQAMNYGFLTWRDFFNDRQLLALGWLRSSIARIQEPNARKALSVLFSGVLEFNSLFASYKGEGTGAVRHMFSHHVLKPERVPIEANVWGTSKSSGSFSGLYRNRLVRAMEYRASPTEVSSAAGAKSKVCSPPFAGAIHDWPESGKFHSRGIYVSCGNSAVTCLPARSIDLVVTDPPFFDNVHYSELADFFHAWQQLDEPESSGSTRSPDEVQDKNAFSFAAKLAAVFKECHRVLKNEGLLIFSYHHSREEGWEALAEAVLGSGFIFVNSHPVRGELSVAAPKSQAKVPIQLDIILVCRKQESQHRPCDLGQALNVAELKIRRLQDAGFRLSKNDCKIIVLGQVLTTLNSANELEENSAAIMSVVERSAGPASLSVRKPARQLSAELLPLFDRNAEQ